MSKDNIDVTFDDVIADGIRFLYSLTAYYGTEKGLEIWDQLNTVIDPEVRGQVLFAMLKNSTTDVVKFKANSANGVEVIKTIRSYTGMSLKEAKDVMDESRSTFGKVVLSYKQSKDLRKDLIVIGCTII